MGLLLTLLFGCKREDGKLTQDFAVVFEL